MGLTAKLKNWLGLWKNQFYLKNNPNRRCEENDTVLIIKLDAIGDFIIWLDSAKEYKGLFPQKKCVLLCNNACKGLAEATGYFEEVLTLNIKKFEVDADYRNSEIKRWGEMQFGILIQTAYSRTQHMDMVAAAIPANKKIGFVSDESKSNVSRSVLTKKSKRLLDGIYDQLIPSGKSSMMELERNKEFIQGLGKKDFISATPDLPKVENVELPYAPYFAVFPGASTKIKMWRSGNYAEVVDYILEKTDWIALICGGKEETYLYEDVSNQVSDKKRVINYCGKTGLVELIEIVRNAKLVISNDTSGIHYAVATGTPAVCPFGEYNYGRFLPYEADIQRDNVKVCSANVRCRNCASGHMSLKCIIHILKTGRYLCLDMVTVTEVKSEIDRLLQKVVGEDTL